MDIAKNVGRFDETVLFKGANANVRVFAAPLPPPSH